MKKIVAIIAIACSIMACRKERECVCEITTEEYIRGDSLASTKKTQSISSVYKKKDCKDYTNKSGGKYQYTIETADCRVK